MSIRYAQCGDLELAYETFGSPQDPTVMLVMGLGSQMVAWADEFCTMIADEGFQVVRFDNRDVGLSTHFDSAGTPNLTRVLLAGRSRTPRTCWRTWPTTRCGWLTLSRSTGCTSWVSRWAA